ncbi:MAG: hypothetical protein JWP76_2067 [Dactylosporangium sp.]|jgi:hypothetical protein|nr:hypothetical protein [Dactylosporangium sp.]
MADPDRLTLGGAMLIAVAVAAAVIPLRHGRDNTPGADDADPGAGQSALSGRGSAFT